MFPTIPPAQQPVELSLLLWCNLTMLIVISNLKYHVCIIHVCERDKLNN